MSAGPERDWRTEPMEAEPPGPLGITVGALRLGSLGLVTFGGLALLLIVRLAERPMFGPARPVTPWITQAVCRAALVILGVTLRQSGRAVQGGAAVSNHISWLDIFVLNACDRVYFVAKSDVAGWPGIGWLARATGTVFIARKGLEAERQRMLLERRLASGHRLLFFPEGTSTDGARILSFKSTLFAAFFATALRDAAAIQPVTLHYTAPSGQDPRFYGWWGDMSFGPSLWRLAVTLRGGEVAVVWHPPLSVSASADRKALAAQSERAVRSAFPGGS